MKKETTIKVSKEFKEFLFANKKEGEDFEATIKRLVYQLTSPSIPVNQSKYTSEPEESIKPIPDEAKLTPERTKSGGTIRRVTSHLGTVKQIPKSIELEDDFVTVDNDQGIPTRISKSLSPWPK